MQNTNVGRLLITWWASLFLAIPFGVLAGALLFGCLGKGQWTSILWYSGRFYDWLGFRGIPYEFSWPWMTVALVAIGIPYSATALSVHCVLFAPKRTSFHYVERIRSVMLSACGVLVALPVSLMILRVVLPTVGSVWMKLVDADARSIGEWTDPARTGLFAGVTLLLLTVALPYAIVTFVMQSVCTKMASALLGGRERREAGSGRDRGGARRPVGQ
jgi:hypothetical protein